MGRVCGHLMLQGSYKDSGDSETRTGSGYWECPRHHQRDTDTEVGDLPLCIYSKGLLVSLIYTVQIYD